MELKHLYMITVGIVLSILLIFVPSIRRKVAFDKGKKSANHDYLMTDPYFIRKKREYKLGLIAAQAFAILTVLFSCFLLARPVKVTRVEEDKYQRDIILCMDISTSVDDLNEKLVETLKETVSELKGERFGIVIFNSSAVTLMPLTDDYDAVIESLELIRKGLKNRNSYWDFGFGNDFYDEYYISQYIDEGTLVGCEYRGSSLIGDGMASAALCFPKTEDDEERTKIMIFSTDNDLCGDPVVTIEQAAEICKRNNVIVYAIGPEFMTDKTQMQKCVKSTGGDLFVQGKSGTVKKIVDKIEDSQKNLVEGTIRVEVTDQPLLLFVLVLAMTTGAMVITKRLKV